AGRPASSWSGHTRAGAARGGVSGRGVGEEVGQRGRGAGRQRRGRVGRKAEMAQDFAQHVGRLDRGDDGHAAAAAGACQNVEIENPPHQVRPLPVSGLLGRIRLLGVARLLGGGGAGDLGSRSGRGGGGGFRGGGRAVAGGRGGGALRHGARPCPRTGARMPWYRTRLMRGRGVKAASFSGSSTGVKRRWLVPSCHSLFRVTRTRPSGVSARRSCATGGRST